MKKELTALMATAALSGSMAAHADNHIEAPSGTYVNDPAHTRLLWKIEHLGLSNYTARINGVAITLEFDAADPARSAVAARIDPLSIDTGFKGDKDFDAEIATDPKILNAGEFPSIEFTSSAVTMTSATTAEIQGELTLLGITLPVALNAVLSGSTASHPFARVPALGFQATGSFDRTDFGLTFLSGSALGDTIEIEIQTEFIKQ